MNINILPDVIESPVRLNENQVSFIQDVILSVKFPWFYIPQQTFYDNPTFIPEHLRNYIKFVNSPFLGHILLARSNGPISQHDRVTREFSEYYEFFFEIFHTWTKDNNIKYNKIFRANLNLTWYNGDLHTEPHLDHEWSHNNFIMYLTDFDEGQTILFSDDFETYYPIEGKKYHAVAFRQRYHAHRFPKIGQRRVVFVVTFI